MHVILSLKSTINYMNFGKDVNLYPSCYNSHRKISTQEQSADKTCDLMAKDDYRNCGEGEGRAGEGQLLLFTF